MRLEGSDPEVDRVLKRLKAMGAKDRPMSARQPRNREQRTTYKFVGLPADAGNSLLDDYARLSLYVDAEQAH